MAEITGHYNSSDEGKVIAQAYVDMNKRDGTIWRPIHDNFDTAWLNETAIKLKVTHSEVAALIRKKLIEPHGTLVFTDELVPQSDPVKDLAQERMDILEARIAQLEGG